MKASKQAIEHLNVVLKNALTAINQYFLHARMYENQGLGELNGKEYRESILKMKQADKVIRRILFLEGLPNLQDLGKLLIGEDAREMLSSDLKMQAGIRKDLVRAIAHMESVGDYVSRELLDGMLEEDEEFIDWLETQESLIDRIGIKRYLQSQMS